MFEADRPVGIAELTDYVQLNHNAVRQHLAILKSARLVIEEIEERERPGRPRLMYSPHPDATGSWGTPSAYAWLANILTSALRRNQDAHQAGRQEGHRRAIELAGSDDPVNILEGEITRRGFRPTRVENDIGVSFTLGRCPFSDVADSDPETVCQLHLGLAQGLAEGLGGLEIEGLIPKDPHQAGCRLLVRRNRDARAVTG